MRSPSDHRVVGAVRRGLWALAALLVVAALAPLGSAPSAGAAEGTLTFNGGGFGHGVGMSQYGAYGRAADGHTYDEILTYYYTGTAISAVDPVGDIRVRLGLTPATTLTPSAATPVRLDGVLQGTPSGPITVRAVGGLVEADFGGPCPAGACLGSKLVVPLTVGRPVGVSLTQHRYHRGRIVITNEGGNLFVVVRGMSMDEYLYGLAEVPRSWAMEALKAQAVAGRSYAQARATARRAAGNSFDLYYTTSDQYYTGYEVEGGVDGDRWVQAVNATNRRMITYQGQVITAYYSSSNGGHSEDSEYVWVTALPWARGVPDPYDSHTNPLSTWSRTYTVDQLSRWLARSSDTNVGTLQDIEISGPFGVSGRVDKATVTLRGTGGTRTVTGATLRLRINSGAASEGVLTLPSTKFRIGDQGLAIGPERPQGSIDRARVVGTTTEVRLEGWAVDRNTTEPIDVHAYVDGAFAGRFTADGNRPDIDLRFGLGADRGFDIRVDAGLGTSSVCLYGIDVGGPGNALLGCRSFTITDAVPVGRLETVAQIPGPETGVVGGWAFDLDDPGRAVEVHVYVDGAFAARAPADRARPDVDAVHGVGPDHGYRIEFPVTPGEHEVCAYAVNLGPGRTNPLLGCAPLTVREFVEIEAIEVDQLGERIDQSSPTD